MKIKSFGFAAALFCFAGPAAAVTVDSNDYLTANYNFSGVSIPSNAIFEVAVTGYFTGAATTGPNSPFSSVVDGSLYDSQNTLVGSSAGGYNAAPPTVTEGVALLFSGTQDPTGHIVISSDGGSVIDVTNISVFLFNQAGTMTFGNQDITASIVSASVSATPLPASWTMMLIGIAAFGFICFRRKSSPAMMAA